MLKQDFNNKVVQDCLLSGKKQADLSTPVYRYLSVDSFLHLLFYKQLMLSKVTTWPDAFEGAKFDFLKGLKKDDPFASKSKEHFFGSSWALQTEDSSLYKSSDAHRKAEDELVKSGSASMWESYCQNGGVRIKTTIGKIEKILQEQASVYCCYKGKVVYEAANSWEETISSTGLISKLFIKRVSYRHENEFRFVCVSEDIDKSNQLFFDIGGLYDFVDEFLIAPAISSNVWKAKMLYQYAVSLTMPKNVHGTNKKNSEQYCRISNLYGNISEVIE